MLYMPAAFGGGGGGLLMGGGSVPLPAGPGVGGPLSAPYSVGGEMPQSSEGQRRLLYGSGGGSGGGGSGGVGSGGSGDLRPESSSRGQPFAAVTGPVRDWGRKPAGPPLTVHSTSTFLKRGAGRGAPIWTDPRYAGGKFG
eukprot:g6137.t1